MDIFASIFSVVMELFRHDITLFGFTFSFWEVFVFTLVVGVLGYVIGGFFSGS